MGLQKPSIMAGKATIGLVEDDDEVAASAATDICDGNDEYLSLEMLAEHTTVSVGVVEHIAVHITLALEIVVEHSTLSLGVGVVLWSTSQCPWGWRSTSQCPGCWRHTSQCPWGWW